MRHSVAILGKWAVRPDIRAAVTVASLVASGAATYWWFVRNRRRRGVAALLAALEGSGGRDEALLAAGRTLAGLHKTVLRGWLGTPEAAGHMGVIIAAPGVRARRGAREWYYRLASGARALDFGALLIRFDREDRVLSVRLIERP